MFRNQVLNKKGSKKENKSVSKMVSKYQTISNQHT